MTTWNQAMRDRVAVMLREGLSASQIAERLGTGRSAVCGVVHRDKRLREIGFRFTLQGGKSRKVKLSKIAGVLAAPKAKGIHVAAVAARREASASDPGTADLVRVPAHAATFDAGTRKVRLEDLKSDECRFPIGDPREDGFGFCGERRLEGYAYCIHHCRRAYQNFVCREAVAA